MTSVSETASRSRAASVQTVVSKGGIEAWLVEDYTVPIISLEFVLAGGYAQDDAGKSGLTNLLAGLLDEGAGPYDAAAFHRLLEDYAIELSFYVQSDVVGGRLRTLAKNVDKAFELLRLAVNEARLDEDAFERVRGQIAAGLRREANDPDFMARRRFSKVAAAGHPYGMYFRGDIETLDTVTRGDLIDARTKIFARERLKIAAVGAIDADHLGRHLDDVFGPLQDKAILKEIPEMSFAGVGTLEIVDLDIPQSTIQFGRQGIPRKDPDYFAAVVVNHVLGGGVFSARLFREVREKRGLAYSVHSRLSTNDHSAMFLGSTSTKNERAAESLSVIQAEIRSLADDGPLEEELEKAKKYLIGSYDLNFDTSTKIASQLVHLQAEGFGVDYLDNRNKLFEAVSMEDSKRVAKRFLGDGKLLVVVAGRPIGM